MNNNYDKLSKSVDQFKDEITNTLLSAGYISGIILGIIGFTILLIQYGYYHKIRQINQWPVLTKGGTIKDSYMEISSGSTGYSIFVMSTSSYYLYYRTRVSFSYEINGKKYTSKQLSYYEPWSNNPMYAKLETDYYVPGRKVDIRVNPQNPSEAYIINQPYHQYAQLLIGIILTLIGVYVIYKV